MRFTPAQIQELLSLVDVHILQFIGQTIGPKYLTPIEVAILESAGIKVAVEVMTVAEAYKFGILSIALGDSRAESMTYDQLKGFVSSKQFVPLDARELAALASVEFQAYNSIRGLGNRHKGDLANVIIESDKRLRKQYEEVIHEAAQTAIIDRLNVQQMATLIGDKTGDWARDLDRISDFILHDAHDRGRASQIVKTYGEEARVYKRVFNQSCAHCVRLYLTGGMGSKPRIFTVAELMANGSNIGRKAKEWKAVIGPTHPYCRCDLEAIPVGYEWSEEAKRFKLHLTVRETEIASKIKITRKNR